jgi:hypothetical protein
MGSAASSKNWAWALTAEDGAAGVEAPARLPDLI